MPPESREDVRLPEPVARIARAEREEGEEGGEFHAHLAPSVQAHVMANSTATGPNALTASMHDCKSQMVSWWFISTSLLAFRR